MVESINGKLNMLANKYYISYGTAEQKKIDASVATLKSRLTSYFQSSIRDVIEFGSYKRDTILPREFDENSDVDLMIVFDHANLKMTPGTYRNYLLEFASTRYSTSDVYKSKPTVVLELEHIKYDLVPTHEETSIWSTNKTIYIPESDSSWLITDPHGFNSKLTTVNTANGSNIKKVIRLLKSWNAKVGYPIESFSLEQEIASINYFFVGDKSLENYFFRAIDGISQYRDGNYFTPHSKINSLKENAMKVRSNLQAGNISSAITWLGHILPL